MHRKEREVTDPAQIEEILNKSLVMRLGMYDGARPYVVPLNYAFYREGERFIFYFHCAREGRKLEILRSNAQVCVEVDTGFELITGNKACDWSAAYESVIAEGEADEVTDPDSKRSALDLLMSRCGYEGKPSYPDAVLAHTCVIRIEIHNITAKRNCSK